MTIKVSPTTDFLTTTPEYEVTPGWQVWKTTSATDDNNLSRRELALIIGISTAAFLLILLIVLLCCWIRIIHQKYHGGGFGRSQERISSQHIIIKQ